ncbi:MAG: SUMF1/EgtB/PvdO family nonheme iron enzyme, partial [Verrucomicrobia bacterium]|nr:SUMF1/EgtB/PvdO family nonheme iron enzyme [Verrucomicrobiota bacterium]
MEFVEGESLRIRLDRMERIPPQEAVAVTVYIAQALQYAWNKAHLIHRDIKPDNIFLSNAGEVKVGDLGLAKSVGGGETTDMTQTGMVMGSPHYISPEQAQGAKDIDFRADIYSLGCTLYHMLTGKTPYEGDSSMVIMMKHINDPPPAIFRVWPACPMPLGRLVGKMVAKRRQERHANYEELVADLMQVHEKLRQTESVAPVATTPAPTGGAAAVADTVPKAKQTGTAVTTQTKLGNRKLVYAAGGVCAALALAGVLWWAPWKTGEEGSGKRQAEAGMESRLQAESAERQPAKAGTPTSMPAEPQRQETVAPITSPAPVASPAQPQSEATATDAAWQNAINLLPLIDPQKDAVEGQWTLENGELKVAPSNFARLQIPYQAPEEYDFRIVFSRQSGDRAIWQILMGGGRQFDWCLAGFGGEVFGFESIAGKNPSFGKVRIKQGLENGRRYTSLVSVRKDGMKAFLDGRLIIERKTDYQDMGLPKELRLRDERLLGIGAERYSVVFYRVEVREVTGKGRFTRAAPVADSAPSAPQPTIPTASAPFDAAQARRHQEAWAKHLQVPVEMTNSIGMKFVLIPPGEFDMGTAAAQVERELEEGRQPQFRVEQFYIERVSAEAPQHRVKITRPFYLAVCEVTQGEYEQIIGNNPSAFSATGTGSKKVAGKDTRRHPVEIVAWPEAGAFAQRLSALPAETSVQRVYRLPTEAEWEHACRAGTTTRWSCGDDMAALGDYAWFKENSDGATHPVGAKKPNPWGLFDMHGSVWEWCSDRYTTNYYVQSSLTDPQGPPLEDAYRVLRGAGWDRHALGCRSAYRGIGGAKPWPIRNNFIGFRLACEVAARSRITSAAPDAQPPASAAPTPAAPASATAAAALASDGFQPLFNGRDLTGWEGRPEFWSVQDGAICGKTTQETPAKRNMFLVCTAGEFGDFELRAQFKLAAGDEKGIVNSGVQYRSRIVDREYFMLSGYQADLGFMGKKNLSGGFWE